MSDIKPIIGHQLLGLSDDCLVVQNFNINHGIIMGWGGVWMFWLIGLPMALFLAVSPWIPPYGYNENGSIRTVFDMLNGMDVKGVLIYVFIFVVIGGGTMLGITLGFAYANLRRTSKSFSPITFNRKTKTVSAMVKGEIKSVEWKRLRKFSRDKTTISGYVPHRTSLLFIKDLGDTTAIEGTFAGVVDEDYTDTDAVWEYIRTFMDKGPESLNVPASNYLGIMNLDKQPMYSYDFKTSISSNWPWPIIKSKDQNKVLLFFTVVFFWPGKVVFFFHNILADWLWQKMCMRILKNSKATPKYNFEQCSNTITPKDVETVISVEEASKENYLSYFEVRRRLQG